VHRGGHIVEGHSYSLMPGHTYSGETHSRGTYDDGLRVEENKHDVYI
jgi:hypothetical protein